MEKEKIITKEDLDENNYYKHSDSLECEEGIRITANLGYVKFKKTISSKCSIIAEAGSGIEAGWGIEAGCGIVSFLFGGISAKWISCLRIAVGFNIEEEQEIKAEIRKGIIILGKVVK